MSCSSIKRHTSINQIIKIQSRLRLLFIIVLGLLIISCNHNVTKPEIKLSDVTKVEDNSSSTNDYGVINPKAPKETIQYGQLVGRWNCSIENLNKEGVWLKSSALWTFKYILNGHAIQDFWETKPQKTSSQDALYGSNIRIYNDEKKKWDCIWVENRSNKISGIWESIKDENNLVLTDGTDNWIITFYNITKTSFDWKWDFKQKDGSYKTMSKIKAVRTD